MQAAMAEQVLEDVPTTGVPDEEECVTDRAPAGAPAPDEPPMRPGDPTLEQLLSRAEAMGLAGPHFLQYADRRWGRGWKINPRCCR